MCGHGCPFPTVLYYYHSGIARGEGDTTDIKASVEEPPLSACNELVNYVNHTVAYQIKSDVLRKETI